MKKYVFILLLFLFIPTVVFADETKYYIRIYSDKSVTVSSSQGDVDDYSNIFTYENDVLTINEGMYIDYIALGRETTITSNDKPIKINSISSYDSALDKRVHTIVHVDHLHDDIGLHFDDFYTTYINESYLSSAYFTGGDGRSTHDLGIKITKSKIEGVSKTDFNLRGGDYIIEDTDLDVYILDNNNGSIDINNCNINYHYGIYTEGNGSHINITNSTVTPTVDGNSYIEVQNSEGTGLLIKDSIVKTNRLQVFNSTSEKLSIINSTVDVKDYISSYPPIEILNSQVSTAAISSYRSDSNVEKISTIKDSILNIKYRNDVYSSNYYGGTFNIINSIFNGSANVTVDELNIKDSLFELTDPKTSNTYSTLNVINTLSIHNSNFRVSNTIGNLPVKLYYDSPIIDNGLFFTDFDNNQLELVKVSTTLNDTVYNYYEFQKDGEQSSSVKIVTPKIVTFKVKNGTWADGSTDDITITKDIWTKLTNDEIPIGIIGNGEGYWVATPNTDDYIKDDIEYTYVFKEVKGVGENPETGMNYFYTGLSIVLAISLMFVFIKMYKQSYFIK